MPSAVDPDIRLLTAADLEGAMLLSSTAGWNQRLADWRMLLRLAPAGSFAAFAADRIIGTAIGIDYGSFGWIAMMLVDPAYRGHGIGARLLEEALSAVPSDHPVRLDATPMGRPLYQRFGFEDETCLTRHVAESVQQPYRGHDRERRRDVRQLRATQLEAIAALDRAVFGGNRRVVLEWATGEAPGYAQVIDTADGPQYCFGRPGRLFDQIGPVVATEDSAAEALVEAALRSVSGRAVVADVFDSHRRLAGWLQERGFAAQRPLFRMRRPPRGGGAPHPSEGAARGVEYMIFGPEFG